MLLASSILFKFQKSIEWQYREGEGEKKTTQPKAFFLFQRECLKNVSSRDKQESFVFGTNKTARRQLWLK